LLDESRLLNHSWLLNHSTNQLDFVDKDLYCARTEPLWLDGYFNEGALRTL